MKKYFHLLVLLFAGWLAANSSLLADTATVAVEATIQGGTAPTNVNEVALGYLGVKYGNAPYTTARKVYLQFNLAGRNPDTNVAATLTIYFATPLYPQRVQLWGLNQAYPECNADLIWTNAQANELNSNNLLTNGAFTASRIGADVMLPVSGSSPYTFTVPRLGDFLFADRITLVLSGVYDPGNNSQALRIQTNAATLTFQPFTGNTPPVISSISNQVTRINESLVDIPFTIGDAESLPDILILTATSSNPALIPDTSIFFSGSGSNRLVSIDPALDAIGTTLITITVTDQDQNALSNSTSFLLTVLPANTPPTITVPPPAYALAGTASSPMSFVVGDSETAANDLTLAGLSSHPDVLPPESIVFGGSGSNRTVQVTPAPNISGVVFVFVMASDGELTSSNRFPVMVLPSADTVFNDGFEYPDGELIPGSGGIWTARTAGTTRLLVSNKQAQVRSAASNVESGLSPLAWGPYLVGSHAVLYTRFKATWSSLPRSSTGPFVHLNDGTSGGLFAKVYTRTNNAAEGFFRLGIANGEGNVPIEYPVDLSLNSTYSVVTRYDVDAAVTTLWIDQPSEDSPNVVATDAQAPVPIAAVGLRQNAGMGTILVNDLTVTIAFRPAIQQIAVNADSVRMDFTAGTGDQDSMFVLTEGAEANGPYTDLSATFVQVVPGSFSVAVPKTGMQKFFRIRRQPVRFL